MRDLLLAGLTLSTGCVDAISWLGLGKVFSAFMTGNLAFLGFRIGGAAGPSVPRVIAATAAFGIGAALGARIVRHARDPEAIYPRKVGIALLAVLVCEIAFLVLWLAVSAEPARATGDILIALSALAMGMQTAAVFSLGARADFTTAATATFMVLMGDIAGWKQTSGERVRLAATLVGLVAGAVAGTVLMLHAARWAPILPVTVLAAALATYRSRVAPRN